MISSTIQALFKIKIQPNMSEQEKKRLRMYDLLDVKNQAKIPLSTMYKAKNFFLQKKSFLRERGVEDWIKNEKKAF